MITAGRTIRQAITDGTAYEITHPNIFPYGFFPPDAETPAEVLTCARQWFDIPAGTTFDAKRIVGGSIGAFFIECAGTIVA